MQWNILLFILANVKGVRAYCDTSVCLTWEMFNNTLTLSCYISNPFSMVLFSEPNGRFIGDCVPSVPSQCTSYVDTGSLFHDFLTETFIFKLNNMTNKTISGIWKCLHGKGGDVAVVRIGISEGQSEQVASRQTVETNRNNSTPCSSSSRSTRKLHNDGTDKVHPTSTKPTTIRHNDREDTRLAIESILKMYLIPMGIGIVVFIISTFVCTACIIRTCKTFSNSTKPENNANQNNAINSFLAPVVVPDRTDDFEYAYATVNEDEMIKDNYIQRPGSTSDKTSTNSSSDLSNQYLDVVNESPISNTYLSTRTHPKEDDIHAYTPVSHRFSQDVVYVNELI